MKKLFVATILSALFLALFASSVSAYYDTYHYERTKTQTPWGYEESTYKKASYDSWNYNSWGNYGNYRTYNPAYNYWSNGPRTTWNHVGNYYADSYHPSSYYNYYYKPQYNEIRGYYSHRASDYCRNSCW